MKELDIALSRFYGKPVVGGFTNGGYPVVREPEIDGCDGAIVAGGMTGEMPSAVEACIKAAAALTEAINHLTQGLGWDTPMEQQEVYVPVAVWRGHGEEGGGGPTVSAQEAIGLGAIPETIDLERRIAQWPQHFFAK